MGKLTRTEAPQPWGKRVGGGYPNLEDLELAVDMYDLPVLVGPPHPVHGWFAVPHPAPRIKDKHRGKEVPR